MDTRVETYIRRGKFYVEGWLRTEAARTIVALDARQRAHAVGGGVAEIGVHHGKLFILLYLLCQPPWKAVAIDLFDDQHLNVDRSGSGDRAQLLHNLWRHADRSLLVLHQGSSTELSATDLIRLGEGRPRLVSIDGGHTAEITAHDLAMVHDAIVEGGIVVVDDVFNERWPGVADGVHRFFAQSRDLVPFAIGANKTYFCRPSWRDIYYDAVVAASPAATATEFLGHAVAFLDFQHRPGLKDAVVRTAAWQRLRVTPVGRPLRWAWRAGRTLRRGLTRNEGF